MCFGSTETQRQTTDTTHQTNPAVASAATQNLDFAKNLQASPFQSYSGDMVAALDPMQAGAIDKGVGMAMDPSYLANAQSLVNQYSSDPAGHVLTSSIASKMDPYMSKYTDMALAPQLQAFDQQIADQNRGFDANATGAGAFGDTGWGLGRSNLTTNQNIGRTGLVGNAYNAAFNTAIGAGAQDVSNDINTQTTNAGLQEQAIARKLAGANAGMGLQTQGIANAGAAAQLGSQKTANTQAGLLAQYQEFLRKQNDPYMKLQAGTQGVASGAAAFPADTTATRVTQAPDNSGLGLLGSLGGAYLSSPAGSAAATAGLSSLGSGISSMLPFLALSDERAKTDKNRVGALHDGTPVHTFRYIGDPVLRIGVMAQEVERRDPGAVHEIGGLKVVNIHRATAPSRALDAALGIAA